jgi:prepilin-type processing-associated H-X9-DG protein
MRLSDIPLDRTRHENDIPFYDPTAPKRAASFHSHRVAGGHRRDRDFGSPAVAGLEQGQEQSQGGCLRQQYPANQPGLSHVGVPKANRFFGPVNSYTAKDEFPGNDYWTDIQTYVPLPDTGWSSYYPGPDKQPACRHNERAVLSFFDGHSEAWPWSDLRNNKQDVFAMNSL